MFAKERGQATLPYPEATNLSMPSSIESLSSRDQNDLFDNLSGQEGGLAPAVTPLAPLWSNVNSRLEAHAQSR
jgi:hypothetical protein